MLLFTFLFPPISAHSAVVTFAMIVKSRAFYCPYWSSQRITKVHANEAHTSHPAVGKEALIVLKEELSTEYQLYNYIRSICLNFVILLKNKNDYCSLKIHSIFYHFKEWPSLTRRRFIIPFCRQRLEGQYIRCAKNHH